MCQFLKRSLILLAFILIHCNFCILQSTNETVVCGRVDTNLHFDNETELAPIENKWLALIELRNETEDIFTYERIDCVATLISQRHLLAPAQCFLPEHAQSELYYVVLGAWNRVENTDEWTCDDDEGFCIPPAEDHKVADVAVHPDYDYITLSNNIAVLRLEEDVTFTNYIEPICMMPKGLKQESLIGQYYYLSGFAIDYALKTKTSVKTISRQMCERADPDRDSLELFSETHFCGFQQTIPRYEYGSTLIGLEVENDEPKSYYLVGYLLYSKVLRGQRTIARFQDIRSYMGWINDNLEG